MKRVCFLFNVAAHYRLPIYTLLGSKLDSDIYVGDKMRFNLKKLDYKKLPGFRKVFHNIFFGPFYWQKGALKLIRKRYVYFVTVGDVYCLSTWLILLCSRIFHYRVVSWTHGIYGKESKLKEKIKLFYFRLHYHIMTYGEYGRQQTIKAGIPESKVTAIGNSLDSDRNIELRTHLKPSKIYVDHFGNTFPTILYCGRIQKIKRLDMILNAVADLNKDKQRINVTFVGADNDNVNLNVIAKSMGIEDNVWFYGPCYNDAILAELFYNAHICVSPGNVGLTSIHALSFGCPVITHDNFKNQMPEFEAIRKGITGDFFKEGCQEDLNLKIMNWISKTSDERDMVRTMAYKDIDSFWNIHSQFSKISKILSR